MGVLFCSYLFWKCFGYQYAVILFICLVFPINPLVRPLSLQLMSAPIAIFLSFAFLALVKKKENLIPWVFFFQGSFFCFIDFLTTPMECLGYLLLFRYLLIRKLSINEQIITLLTCVLFWAFGYFGTWLMKWGIAVIYLGLESFRVVLDQALFRTVGTVDNLNFFELIWRALASNWYAFWFYNKTICVIAGLVCLILLGRIAVFNQKIQNLIPLFIGLIPFIWYIIFANHSYIHIFFTFRSLGVFCCGLMISYLQYRQSLMEFSRGRNN